MKEGHMLDTNALPLVEEATTRTVLDNLASDSTGYIANTLNTALKNKLVVALNNRGYNSAAELIQNIPEVDIAANKDVSLKAFITQQLQGRDGGNPDALNAINKVEAQLSETTTVGTLLDLDLPLHSHPILADDAQRAKLIALLSTSPALNSDVQNKFINAYIENQGPTIQAFWSKLSTMPDFQAPGLVEEIQFTLQLEKLTQGNLPLVQAIQDSRKQQVITSMYDLTKLSQDDWTKLINTSINGQDVLVPASMSGTTHYEQVTNYSTQIINTLKQAFPTPYIAQTIAQPPTIDLDHVNIMLANNPYLDPSQPLPATVKWGTIDADQQAMVEATMETLRQEIVAYPDFDYRDAFASGVFRNTVREAVAKFLESTPEFDFATTHVDNYFAHPDNGRIALTSADMPSQSTVIEQLKRTQRVFQITKDPQAIHTLLGTGLHSAQSIASIPKASFVASYQNALGGAAQASTVHAQAQQIHATTSHLYMTIYNALHDVNPRVIGNNQQAVQSVLNQQIPNWATLFGPLDLAESDDCHSLYSPAAYFVDLLQFIKKSDPTGNTLQKALFARRPDLQYIKLSCENTNTPIPYVDLVNEILETYIAIQTTYDPTITGDPSSPTADELSVNPQHINNAAYTALLGAVYPFNAPYNRSLEITRIYLSNMGSSYNEVMSTFQKNSSPSAVAIACEYLSIAPEVYVILVDTTLNPAYYGYASTTNPATLKQTLNQVLTFLQQTGIHYLDLIELLKTRFLNPQQQLTLQDPSTTIEVSGDLSHTVINNLDDITVEKAHRFIRLWEMTNRQIRDLDRITATLGATDITSTFLSQLAQVQQLLTSLSIPLTTLLSFWVNIDTYEYETSRDDSLYTALFQNKAVLNPVDPAFALNATPSDLLNTSALISDHTALILAALRISAAELNILTTSVVTNNALTLANLSMLYRHVVLARALNLSINDLIALKTLCGINPFTDSSMAPTGSPATCINFITTFNTIKQSGFSVAQLNYLYQHIYDPNAGIAPLQTDINLFFRQLSTGLTKIVNDTTVVPDPTGDLLRQKLSIILSSTLVDQAMKIVDGSSILSQADQTTFINQNFAVFLNAPGSNTSTQSAVSQLLAGSTLTHEARFAYVLAPLMNYLRIFLSRSLVKQTLSSTFNLSMNIVEALVGTTPILLTHTTPAYSLMQDFLTFANANPAPSVPATQLYYLLHKSALLINTLGLTVKELVYLETHSSDFANFDLNKLPLAPGGFTIALFNQWQALANLVALRNSLPTNAVSLVDVFGAAVANNSTTTVSTSTMQQLLAATSWDPIELATLVGWSAQTLAALIGGDPTKLAALIGTNGFTLNDTNLRNATWLLTLQKCLSLGQRLSVSVKHLFDWATPKTSPALMQSMAQEIKNTLRAKYDDDQWLVAAKPLTDQLRESQKSALITYVLQMPTIKAQNFTTSSDLYENFLIDVDMSASAMTSRILQATSTVQLFVERCLMGLEPGAANIVIDENTWQWMKRYRIWEANRQVFLYPENFLEPALRDDQSSFFQDLEAQLLQQDITTNNVEDAFMSYLQKLDQVARLEICGMYWEEELGGTPISSSKLDWRTQPGSPTQPDVNVLHVFARSFAVPHIYYYRTLTSGTTWTGWEKVDVGIEGDHLIPVVYNRRLYLFWPLFTMQADPTHQNASSSTLIQPVTTLQIQLAWSEYKQGKWTPKQVSSASINTSTGVSSTNIQRNQYLFKGVFDTTNTNTLDIQVLYTQGSSTTELGWFNISGSNGVVNVTILNPGTAGTLLLPTNSQSMFMDFVENTGGNQLALYANNPLFPSVPPSTLTTLNQTPALYSLLYPHQFASFTLQAPFFYQDDQRTYFVTPDLPANTSGGGQVAHANAVIPNYDPQRALTSHTALVTHTLEDAPIFTHVHVVQISEPEYSSLPATNGAELNGHNETSLLKNLQGVDPDVTTIVRPQLGPIGNPPPPPPFSSMVVTTNPSQVSVGIPQTVTISATDIESGQAVAGMATFTNGGALESHPTNIPFTTTFHRLGLGLGLGLGIPNTLDVTVSATGYVTLLITIQLTPTLTAVANPAQIELNVPQSITVTAVDADSQKPINGTVILTNGTTGGGSVQESHPTNVSFTTTLYMIQQGGTAANPTAVVNANNYPPINVPFTVYYPKILRVNVQPNPILLDTPQIITIFTTDTYTGNQVSGSVTITNGTATGGFTTESHPTNTPFTTTLYMLQSATGNKNPGGPTPLTNSALPPPPPPPITNSVPPTATINAAGYPSVNIVLNTITPPNTMTMRFLPYLHPHVPDFIKALNRQGIDGLLTLSNQQLTDGTANLFLQRYQPTNIIEAPYPAEDVDFGKGGYALYNWELFFHTPLTIATKLSSNQQFEDAQHWFHYIFNPSAANNSAPLPNGYWRTLPFYQNNASQRIQDLLVQLNSGDTTLAQEVQDWRQNPFEPYHIARMRIIAYQKYIVMKYIDNLIAWGDQLFSQDTMESINEATQLYVLASQILGPRPEQIPPRGTVADMAYADLLPNLDSFSNALVALENLFPFSGTGGSGTSGTVPSPTTFYFSIPQNNTLLGYWDTVEDRLFKIRHSLNLQGIAQQLPLFSPPINPALLIQAAALGVDLSSALSDINAAVPRYRFTYMIQKALELCSDLKTLGSALLSALEKKDGEALAILRASQETALLQAVRQVKTQQITEAQNNINALQKTLEMTQIRHDFYQNIQFMNDWENAHLALVGAGGVLQLAQGIVEIFAGVGEAIPNATVGIEGVMGTPVVTVSYGGSNIGGAAQTAAQVLGIGAALANTLGSMSATMGGYHRREDEWQLQVQTLSKELDQINQQIAATQIRAAIAQTELNNQDLQIAHASAIEDFLHSKYTNQELYNWMVTQVSSIFFQSYQMVYDLAKRAERAYQFERGLTVSNYIKFGYWDSLRSGLFSGEQLYLDLKRLELAYIDQNKREYEIARQISLMLLNPLALISLKETGTCIVNLPELLFDMDYPGHYMRRIKNAALTIPCVAGPYTSINCTLTLLSNKIRTDSSAQGQYVEQPNDSRFVYDFGAIESITTSSAQNDSGMFELNFRDERYLPFEGDGAISSWRIDLPLDCNAFDFETISDVIIRLNYTAREGGSLLAQAARQARDAAFASTQTMQQRLFSARHEFFNDWYRFLHPINTATSHVLPLDLTMERFPFLFRKKTFTIHAMQIFLKLTDGFVNNYAGTPGYKGSGQPLALTLATTVRTTATTFPVSLQLASSPIAGIPYAEALNGKTGTIGNWSITVQSTDIAKLDSTLQQVVTTGGQSYVHLNPDAIEDLWILCQYSVQ